MVATGIVDAVVLRRFMRGQIDSRLDTQINTLVAALSPAPDGGLRLLHEVEGPPFDRPGSGWYWEVLGDGRVLARSRSLDRETIAPPDPGDVDRPPPPGDRPRPPLAAEAPGPGDVPLRLRFRDLRIGPIAATVLAAAPLKALTDPLDDVLLTLTGGLAVLGIALLVAALVQVRVGLEPLRRLEASLAAVRTGRLDLIPADQPSEIRPLVVELNSLLEQNAENLERARRHVANLAHGLKTPLATLAVELDAPGRDPDGRFGRLIAVLDRRIRHHLGRARAAALGGPARARVDLALHVSDLALALPRIYADRRIAAEIAIDPAITLGCEAQDLDEMLGNLMDNAFKWARETVRIGARIEGRRAVVTVEDDGAGLAADAIPDALRPGRRLDEAAPGHGFGLPITRELAELYGGGLVLGRSAGLGGLRAELTLPLADAG